MQHFFTILGGMGTLATESYIHLINKYTPANKDQDYLNYILVNHATIPDRTTYIQDHSQPSPLRPLIQDIKQQNQLKPDFYTLPCNTAHYFYHQLQDTANAPILNMPAEAIASIQYQYPHAHRIGLIATQGTLEDRIYNKLISNTNYQLVLPTAQIEHQVMLLIYKDVKDNGYANLQRYQSILHQMIHDKHCDAVILGCTELSYVQEKLQLNQPVIDAQAVLAKNTVNKELNFRK